MTLDRDEEVVAQVLRSSVSQLDEVVGPWGFEFHFGGISGSHCGPFASGRYVRGHMEIAISCREQIDNLIYQRNFLEESGSCGIREQFSMGHRALMRGVLRLDDARVIEGNAAPKMVIAKDNGDIVQALRFDWSVLAFHVLQQPCGEFDHIVRQGYRVFDITR